MSTQRHSLTSRFFRSLKIKTEPGGKGNTIKKAAPETQIDESTQDEQVIAPTDDAVSYPRHYYKPRPVPHSFVIGEVQKVSNNGKPPDSVKAQEQVPKTVVATQADDPADTKNAPDFTANPEKSLTTAARADAPVELITGTAATRRSVDAQQVLDGVNGERRPQPTFDLLLGQQDPTSPYFTRRYFSEPYVADARDASKLPRDILHHISELDSQAFEVYKMYTNTGKIGFRYRVDVKNKYLWIASWPLMNAHILGCMVEEPAFADRVMDTLGDKLPLGLAPDFKSVEHLFDGSRMSIPDVLKLFVADRFVNAQQRSHVILDTSAYPETFKEAVLQSALRHLAYSRNTAARPGCAYHTHRDEEACYKTRVTPVNTLKEERLAAARENSARDAEFVNANALQNGVKSVDWEQRRAAARQALNIDTYQAWTSSQLLENGDGADGKISIPDHANGTSESARVSDRKTTGDDNVLRANSTRQFYDLTRTPNNSPVLQSRSTKTHLITKAPSVAATNGHAPAYEAAVSPSATPSQTSHAFLLAELDGNSVNATRPIALAVKYKSSTERMRASESEAMTSSVVTNDAGEHVAEINSLGNGATASDRRVGELTTEYERCVSCPGAYPRSDICV